MAGAGLASLALLTWVAIIGFFAHDKERAELVSNPLGCMVNGAALLFLLAFIAQGFG